MIVQDGLRRMYAEQEDVFYYLTVMNENYQHPGMPEGREDEVREGIIRGMYLLREGHGQPEEGRKRTAGAAAGLRHHPARGDRRPPSCWSRTSAWPPTCGACPSFTELGRDGIAIDRWNMLHPGEEPTAQLRGAEPGRRDRPGRWSPRPTTCAPSPTRSGPTWTGATGCWAPTGSAARTTGATCAGTSRSTGTTSCSPRSAELAAEGAVPASAAADAIASTASTPTRPHPRCA